jgi:DnaK suppressor protein
MTSTLMPTPDRRRPELTASLRHLRTNLEQQRTFHQRQLAELTGPSRAFSLDHDDADELLADAARRTLGDIEIALNRMRTNRYGICLYCGGEIPIERLRAIPQIDCCRTCEPA